MMKKAEILRNRRYESIFNENNGFFDKAKMKGDFLAYFKGVQTGKISRGSTSITFRAVRERQMYL